MAHRLKENIEVSTRKAGYYAERKVSTKFINYLYRLVEQDLLISSSPVQLDLFYKFGYAPTKVKASGASSVIAFGWEYSLCTSECPRPAHLP